MTQQRPLVDALVNFQQRHPISFHVPGHKNGTLSGLPDELKSALKYDFTELAGLDDLHYPEEAIDEAQKLLAEAYGAKQSFFLVNGSTAGNLAMVFAVCEKGDTLLVQRNSHKSVFHALELAGVQPVYLAPEWNAESLTAGSLRLGDVRAAIEAHPQAKALVLTHPNYYGMAATDLSGIILYCHGKGIPVLVDEAHGAHFLAGSPFPESALALGADVVVQSAHKTLPAMTMGSFLHVQGNLVASRKIKKYLRMLQSSSPSYLIMASLDDARAYIENYSQPDMQNFLEKRKLFVEALKSIPQLEVYEPNDPLKLMLRVSHHSGFQLKAQLEEMDIHAELADPYQVLLILPLLKQLHSYPFAEIRSRVKEAVRAVLQEEPKMVGMAVPELPKISEPDMPFDALDMEESEWLPFAKGLGRISAEMIVPYPPGIPLVLPGERWTPDKLESLADYLAASAQIQGEHRLEEKLICVLAAEKGR
ncbi:MAG TPA: aminotransferase class I/II-fold pyridoxal phosphate-dependent enzyme [Planococcus sp. (in: firmicutes)]|nr:aminotransferase class I/II-fold pyridoxal phosphate-dependent enzyme [Planococcus sp. (in: firmicutes)]